MQYELTVPTVLDRVIQQAIVRILGLIFDPYFSESSCGFRPGKSAHDGVRQVKKYIGHGCKVAVDMDLSKFFDTVNHDVLMHRVSRRIEDKRVLKLIGKYLRAGVMVSGRLLPTPLGVPQGVLSHRCLPIFFLMTWTRNWKNVATSSFDMPMTSLFW